jgi:hypothetical protein
VTPASRQVLRWPETEHRDDLWPNDFSGFLEDEKAPFVRVATRSG